MAALLSLLCVAALALRGQLPYRDEFRGRWRQIVAAFLLIGILAVTVFLPVTNFHQSESLDLSTIWFPTLFVGHFLLALFLGLWWTLRGDVSLAAFLGVGPNDLLARVGRGLVLGCVGWLLTVMITGAAASAMTATGRAAAPIEIPPIMVWLAELPLLYKLLIIAAAMTIEEGFFRGFLQPRVGWFISSVLFACSHFSYGLPFMIVGVFTFSLVIGRSFARTGDLLPCIVAHGVFDGVQLLIILPWAVQAWGAAA